VAIGRDEQPLARVRLVADRCQTQRLLAWAETLGTERTWAVESAEGLGKLLAQQLLGAGEHVIDVPPTLAARVRLLGSTKAGKSDPNDALATAIAGLRHCGLRAVRVEDHTAVIRMVIDRYDDLVALRTQAACRLHVALRELIAGGAPRRLGADLASLSEAEQREAAVEKSQVASAAEVDTHAYVSRYAGAVYEYREPLVEAIVNHGGQQALDASFRSPPSTHEHVLFPQRYIDGKPPLAVSPPAADGTVSDEGTIGVFKLGVMLGGEPGGGAAARWGGDSLRGLAAGRRGPGVPAGQRGR
jgi:hypothetical protein